MDMKFPRVLVSSIDVWNNTSGSDTFTNLLSGYDSDKVANVFFRSGIPSSPAADRYFYVCENSVIKSIFMWNARTGWEVHKGTDGEKKEIEKNSSIEKTRYSFFSKHRLWLFIYAQEICWKIGRWRSSELTEFVDDFDPEVLFFPIESYIHFNRINRFLIEKTGVPAIAIIWDDNFTYKGRSDLGFLIHRFFLRRSVKKLIDISSKVFVINAKMQKECKEIYGIEAEILTKGANLSVTNREKEKLTSPLRMVYTGKLVYGRLATVQMIADVLDAINHKSIKIEFDIYSGTKLSVVEVQSLQKLGVHFCGSVRQDEIIEIQQNADLLLMAEALSGKHMYDARLSFSTKLVDYLARGKCIVAVGPSDIAPIEYLKDTNAAMIATSREEVAELFLEKVSKEMVVEYGKRARKLAEEKHNIREVQGRLYSAFEKVVE